MSIDMGAVRQLFFEESIENLDVMESGLLDLEIGTTDSELINKIFRSAHSIKGAAGIFKFEQVVAFSHVIETLLDEIRNDEHVLSQDLIDLLLHSGDMLRNMLTALQQDETCDIQQVIDCQLALQKAINSPVEYAPLNEIPVEATGSSTFPAELSEPSHEISSLVDEEENNEIKEIPQDDIYSIENIAAEDKTPVLKTKKYTWHIHFKPYENLLKTGNDPINLFNELRRLGNLSVRVNVEKLPVFDELLPHNCYLSWELELISSCSEIMITDIFDWVESECDLSLTKVQAEAPIDISSNTESLDINKENKALGPDADDNKLAENINIECSDTVVASSKTADNIPSDSSLPTEDKKEEVAPKTTESKPPALSPPIKHKNKVGTSHSANESSSIRVNIDKIDALINIVGELVITQSMLEQLSKSIENEHIVLLQDGLAQLERHTRELQENVMQVRMLPISYSFNRFPRLVHDLSTQLGKKVELKLSGEHTELDKIVLEKMSDPLVHLVRNALDHGIELPEVRRAAGKNEIGVLHLHAYHQGGNIIIQITDDGAGFELEKIRQRAVARHLIGTDDTLTEEQLYDFIFQAGFSTAVEVSDISGRGVGMDVVRRNIRELGGTIDVRSQQGKGSTFSIRLPLTLAILDGQLVRVGDNIYILSLLSIVESLRVKSDAISSITGKAEVYRLRHEYIPVLRLYQLFNVQPSTTELDEGLLVIVEGDGRKIGLFVDELLSQQQIVIKSLQTNYKQVEGISGATILGDGSVALILDIVGLIDLFQQQHTLPNALNVGVDNAE